MTAPAQAAEAGRRFGDVVAVEGVSLEVHPGEIVGLLGANGAGKTTLLRMILGLLSPTSGTVGLFGSPPSLATRRRLGYMPQGLGLYDDLTVSENLAFVAGVHGVRPRLDGLDEVASVPVGRLPLGLRRRAAFAAAVSHDPELLVLDEPTSGVGPLARAELWDTIHDAADREAAVLVTTHYMDEAEQCDRLVVMAAGREVASGSVDHIVSGHDTLELETTDLVSALDRLDAAGITALPAGRVLRLPGASADRVVSLLGDAVTVRRQAATLEEAFIILSRSHRR